MTPLLLQELRARLATIRQRWEILLRIEPVRSPLGHPDALVHYIPDALEMILSELGRMARRPVSLPATKLRLSGCDCGNNPYLAFYGTGERVMVEALVLVQAGLLPHDRCESDLAELVFTIRRRARLEIDSFCGICTHRNTAAKCRHVAIAG
jgi:hypothetical protein